MLSLRTNQEGLPILDQFSEEGFVDCVFKINNLEEGETYFIFDMKAFYNEKNLSIRVKVNKNIQAGFDQECNVIQGRFYDQGVVFMSTGTESDNLLNVMAKLYGIDLMSIEMTEEESFTAFALHQEEFDIRKDAVKIKIFGRDKEEDSEDEYNESFFNLDLTNGLVFWNEKDQEYRVPLILALTKRSVED